MIDGGTGTKVGSNTDEGTSGILYIHNPTDTATSTLVRWECTHENGNTGFLTRGLGLYSTAGDCTQIRFKFGSGNISSGEFRLYGVRK
jgi:hypothetical protein